MSLRGYSYYQKGRLDELQAESLKRLKEVGDKVWDYDYDAEIGKLDDKDEEHFEKIMDLQNDKVVLADYEAKVAKMTNGDTTRHMALNNLDNAYGQKASKIVFDNVVTELRALDDNHEMRLDELEKRLGATQVDLDDRITQELNQKINSTEFEAMLANVNAGQTGLAQDITNLLMTPEMLQLNTDQDALIALKADKAQFDADSAAIASRHYDFEKRFLAIDQFFRLMAKTYKLTEKSNGNEIVYDAIPKNIKLDKLFTVDEKRTGRLILKLTDLYAYNIFTNKISVVNGSNNPLGFGVKSDFNPMTLTGNISIAGELIFPLHVRFLNLAGDILYEDDVTDVEYLGLPNPSLVAIGYGTEAYNFTAGVATTIQPTTKTGTFGAAVITPSSSWLTINKDTGVISVAAGSTVSQQTYEVEVTSQDGFEKATTTVTINITDPIVTDPIVSGFRTFGNTAFDVSNFNGTINVQVVAPNGDIYIGGAFGKVDNIQCYSIARWIKETGKWEALGATPTSTANGVNGSVNAIAINSQNGDVYIGGGFTRVNWGGIGTSLAANFIAKWNSQHTSINGGWSVLGATPTSTVNGVNSIVNAIAISGSGDVYVGGAFTNVFSIFDANRIARWNSQNTSINGGWSVLGATPTSTVNGVYGNVNAIAISGSGDVYIGGGFTSVNWDNINLVGFATNRIARWNSTTTGTNGGWSVLGTTPTSTVNGVIGNVTAIAVNGNDVYVGGDFYRANWDNISATGLTANRIARWNLGNVMSNGGWSVLGETPISTVNGVNTTVNTIAVNSQNGDVYVGGSFTRTNWSGTSGLLTNCIARWNLGAVATNGGWSVLGETPISTVNGFDNTVFSIAVNNQSGDVYVGGSFTRANWDGIAATSFTAIRFARWNLAAVTSNGGWNTVSFFGTNGSILAQVVAPNGDIYIGGNFTWVDNVLCNNIARWVKATGKWEALGATPTSTINGVNNTVNAIAINSQSSDVYVCGSFTSANWSGGAVTSLATRYIARWNLTEVTSNGGWSALGNPETPEVNGVNTTVNTIAVNSQNGDVYVGGSFTRTNWSGTSGLLTNRIARWNLGAVATNGGWSVLGETPISTVNGVNITVTTIAINSQNGDVYIGGGFTRVNWTGSNTTSLLAYRIARWNLGAVATNGGWSALGATPTSAVNGVNSSVSAIAISGNGDVYVGGIFTSANWTGSIGLTAYYVAKWNSTMDEVNGGWSALGATPTSAVNGVNSSVSAIAISGNGDVYVGGIFTSANWTGTSGTLVTNRITKWNSNEVSNSNGGWSVLGETPTSDVNGTNSTVSTIAIDSDNNIIIGGSFNWSNFDATANTGDLAWAITKYVP